MPPLNQISKEEIEKFEKTKQELKDWQHGTVYKMYDREEECEVLADDVDRYFPTALLVASHLRLIDGMIELIKKKKIVVEREMNQYEVEHNQELEDLISKLQSEKENIKNENNK